MSFYLGFSFRVPIFSAGLFGGLVINDRFIFASGLNVSEGGICLSLEKPCEESERLKLKFFLRDPDRSIEAMSEIVWARWSPLQNFVTGLCGECCGDFVRGTMK